MMTSLGNVIYLLHHLNSSTSKYTPTVYDIFDVEDVRQDPRTKRFSYTEVLEHKSVWQSVHSSTIRLFLAELVDAKDASKDLSHNWTKVQGSEVQTHHCIVSPEQTKVKNTNPQQHQEEQQHPRTYSVSWCIRKATGARTHNAMGVPGMGSTDADFAYLTDSQYRAANGLPEISRATFDKSNRIDIPLASNTVISSFCLNTHPRTTATCCTGTGEATGAGGGFGAETAGTTEARITGGEGSAHIIYR